MRIWYRRTSSFAKYLSNLRRLPTIICNPRLPAASCLCCLKCSVSSLIRSVNTAIWTSTEPVSFSCLRNFSIVLFFTWGVNYASLSGKRYSQVRIQLRSSRCNSLPALSFRSSLSPAHFSLTYKNITASYDILCKLARFAVTCSDDVKMIENSSTLSLKRNA